jgi:hypothetical protein
MDSVYQGNAGSRMFSGSPNLAAGRKLEDKDEIIPFLGACHSSSFTEWKCSYTRKYFKNLFRLQPVRFAMNGNLFIITFVDLQGNRKDKNTKLAQ